MSEVTQQYQYSQYYRPQYQTPWYYHNYPGPAPQGQYYNPYPNYYQPRPPAVPGGVPNTPTPQPHHPPYGNVNPYYYHIEQQLRPLRQPIGTHILHGVARLASNNWGLVTSHFQQIRPLAVAKTNQIIQEIKTMVLAGQGAQVTNQWLMAKIQTAAQDIYTQLIAQMDPNVAAGVGGSGGQVQGQ